MSEISINEQGSAHKTGWLESIVYKLLVAGLFVISAVSLAAGRLVGRRGQQSLFREAREAAYAVAGYAFKY